MSNTEPRVHTERDFTGWDIIYASDKIDPNAIKVDDIGLLPGGEYINHGYPYIAKFEKALAEPMGIQREHSLLKYLRTLIYGEILFLILLNVLLEIYK